MLLVCAAGCLQLTALDISANPLGDAGGVLLGSFLASPACRLTHLDVHACNIGNDGGAAIIQGLSASSSVKAMNCRANNFSDALVPLLPRAACVSLPRTILLSSNDFSLAGCEELMRLSSPSLTLDAASKGPTLEAVCSVQ